MQKINRNLKGRLAIGLPAWTPNGHSAEKPIGTKRKDPGPKLQHFSLHLPAAVQPAAA